MADNKKAPTKRTVSTPAERIAKLEADLKAARDRFHAKDRKRADTLHGQRQKLNEQRADIEIKLDNIETELDEIHTRVGDEPVTDGVGDV